jgi:hypothetical protein
MLRSRRALSAARTSQMMGPLSGPKFRKFSYWRLQKTRPFTPAAARLIAGGLKSKIGTYQSETLRQEDTFELVSCSGPSQKVSNSIGGGAPIIKTGNASSECSSASGNTIENSLAIVAICELQLDSDLEKGRDVPIDSASVAIDPMRTLADLLDADCFPCHYAGMSCEGGQSLKFVELSCFAQTWFPPAVSNVPCVGFLSLDDWRTGGWAGENVF